MATTAQQQSGPDPEILKFLFSCLVVPDGTIMNGTLGFIYSALGEDPEGVPILTIRPENMPDPVLHRYEDLLR